MTEKQLHGKKINGITNENLKETHEVITAKWELPLHEKKISDFINKLELLADNKMIKIPDGRIWRTFKKELKQWRIAIVKNCKNIICDSMGIRDKCGGKSPTGYRKKKILRCQACQRDIDHFELTEEDLKNGNK